MVENSCRYLANPETPCIFRLVQHQQHEHVIRYSPFALDAIHARWPEPKSGVIVSMPQNDDEWAIVVLEFFVAGFNQLATDTLTLIFRDHSHRAQSCSRNHAADSYRAIHNVTDDATIHCRHQGERNRSVGPQCIDDVAFLVLSECALVHFTDSRGIIRTFFSNFDQHVLTCFSWTVTQRRHESARVLRDIVGSPNPIYKVKLLRDHQDIDSLGIGEFVEGNDHE